MPLSIRVSTAGNVQVSHVLACALGAQAALIVTRDHDLLKLGTFRDIRILAAREALDLIATAAR